MVVSFNENIREHTFNFNIYTFSYVLYFDTIQIIRKYDYENMHGYFRKFRKRGWLYSKMVMHEDKYYLRIIKGMKEC